MIRSTLPPDLKTGILHLGLGAFHRAHQAPFTEDAIHAMGGDWGIEAVSMRRPDLAHRLAAQDHRYTLIEQRPHGPHLREISVIRRTHALSEAPDAVVARIADPAIHIITLTVTEKAYGPALATLIGQGLALRRAGGHGGLTLLSCDNLPENGAKLSALVLGHTAATDPILAEWIRASCTFPSSMVDRITPAATAQTFALAEAALGHPDRAAIETEPFSQWVIEDRFAGPRPVWEAAGVEIVPDVAPYEAMKLRLLNGSHSLIAYLGALADLEHVRDVMAVPSYARAVAAHMEAAAATLDPCPGLEPGPYAEALVERFENPAIAHRCLQIAMDGSQKLPQRLLTPAARALETGAPLDSFALAIAAWVQTLRGRSANGTPLPLDDPEAPRLKAAIATGPNPLPALARILGATGDVLLEPPLHAAILTALETLAARGPLAAAEAALAS